MARNLTIMDEIATCSDADSLVRILNKHFSTSVIQTLEQVISGVEALLEKSKQRDEVKKRIIPEYLSNADILKAVVTLLGKIPAIVNSQNEALAAKQARERYLVQELSIKEAKINNMETMNASEIDELEKTLEQQKQNIKFLEREKQAKERDLVQGLSKKSAKTKVMDIKNASEIADLKKTLVQQKQKIKLLERTKQTTEIDLVQQLSMKEAQIKVMETSNASEIDELKTTLEQQKQEIRFLERAKQTKERDLVQQLSKKEAKIKNMETTNASEIDELKTTLEQQKQKIGFLERAKSSLEQNRDRMDRELWQMKQQVDTMKLQQQQTPNTNSDVKGQDKKFIEYVSQEQCGELKVAEILEEYEQLTRVHWFSAKGLLDAECSQDIDEKSKLQVLCDIITIAWRAVTAVVTGVSEADAKPSALQLCTEKLDNNFGDDGKSEAYRETWSMVKDCQEIQDYTKSVVRIALAMVLQKPQLEFKLSDTYLGETCQELHFNSVDPQHSTEYSLCHVYPMITTNGELLAKGKVLLMIPQKAKSTFPILNDCQEASESNI